VSNELQTGHLTWAFPQSSVRNAILSEETKRYFSTRQEKWLTLDSRHHRTCVLPWTMGDMTPIGPTRHYVIVCHDGRRIDVDAELMRPSGPCLEFWATLDVIGPRQVCVQRVTASEVLQVEREDGAVWST
jgi:hypothetical protein